MVICRVLCRLRMLFLSFLSLLIQTAAWKWNSNVHELMCTYVQCWVWWIFVLVVVVFSVLPMIPLGYGMMKLILNFLECRVMDFWIVIDLV